MNKIILASKSPRRAQLLQWAEIPFEVIVVETDESFPEGMTTDAAAMHIAQNKAKAVREHISADPDRSAGRTVARSRGGGGVSDVAP